MVITSSVDRRTRIQSGHHPTITLHSVEDHNPPTHCPDLTHPHLAAALTSPLHTQPSNFSLVIMAQVGNCNIDNMAQPLPTIGNITDLQDINADILPQVFQSSLSVIFQYSLNDIKEILQKLDTSTLGATSTLLCKDIVMFPDMSGK